MLELSSVPNFRPLYGQIFPNPILTASSTHLIWKMLLQTLQNIKDAIDATVLAYGVTALALLLGLVLTVVTQTGHRTGVRRALTHLQKYGVSKSNMADQHNSQFDIPEDASVDGPVRIKAIYIHPIKSCGPVEVDRALLTKSGLLFDRCFSFATEIDDTEANDKATKWRFISQRTFPAMSRVKTELWLPHEKSDPQDPLVQAGGCITFSFNDPDPPSWRSRLEACFLTWDHRATPQLSCIVPLQPTPSQIEEFQIGFKDFGIHARGAKGLDIGIMPSVAVFLPQLKKFLGIQQHQNLTLLRCTPQTLTRTNLNLAPLEQIGTPSVHGYTDQQPLNINSLSSVHAVSALLPPENQPLDALRFRANIWITGAPAYAEETWKRYRIRPNPNTATAQKQQQPPRADIAPHVSVVCRTGRCTMTNVKPDMGIFDTDIPAPDKKKGKAQPTTTLVKYRMVETVNKSVLGYLGMHCVPEDADFEEARRQNAPLCIEVGDEIEVLEQGVHVYGSTRDAY